MNLREAIEWRITSVFRAIGRRGPPAYEIEMLVDDIMTLIELDKEKLANEESPSVRGEA